MMPKNRKEKNGDRYERRGIRQIGLLSICVMGSLFLANCGFIYEAEKYYMKNQGLTSHLTEYRQSFRPPRMGYTEDTCVFQGTIKIDSQEYLRYETPKDFANWDKDAKGIVYLLPKQGNGPALIHKTESPIADESSIPTGIVFDLGEERSKNQPQAILESRQEERIKAYLERLKAEKFEKDSILYVCATRTGEGTRLFLFTKKGTEWVEFGPYVVEQPIQPWWIDTWETMSSVGYVVTVPVDTAIGVVSIPIVLLVYASLLRC